MGGEDLAAARESRSTSTQECDGHCAGILLWFCYLLPVRLSVSMCSYMIFKLGIEAPGACSSIEPTRWCVRATAACSLARCRTQQHTIGRASATSSKPPSPTQRSVHRLCLAAQGSGQCPTYLPPPVYQHMPRHHELAPKCPKGSHVPCRLSRHSACP